MPTHIFNYILTLKYFAIFSGSFVEGPTIGLIVGFLVKANYISPLPGYFAHVSGDFAADCLYFSMGYFGWNRLSHITKKLLKPSTAECEIFKKKVEHNFASIIILGKITHVIGLPILFAAGLARYPWYRFVILDLAATLIKSAILIFLGYHFVRLWQKVDNMLAYLGLMGILITLTCLAYLVTKRVKRKFLT